MTWEWPVGSNIDHINMAMAGRPETEKKHQEVIVWLRKLYGEDAAVPIYEIDAASTEALHTLMRRSREAEAIGREKLAMSELFAKEYQSECKISLSITVI